MKSWLIPAVLVGVALGAVRADDVIHYQAPADKGKTDPIRGKIEDEGPGWVKIKPKKAKSAVQTIPAAQIQRIDYEVDGPAPSEYRKGFIREDNVRTAEAALRALESTKPKDDKETKALARDKAKQLKVREQKLAEALTLYQELSTKLGTSVTNEKAQRYIQYKIAHVTSIQAQYDESKVKDAITALVKFKTDHPSGWQIVPAMRELSKLQVKTGDLDEARKTYEFLSEVPSVPADLKQECEFQVTRLYLRAENYVGAEKKLTSLEKSMSADSPQRPFITAYRAETQLGQNKLKDVDKLLAEAVRTSEDPKLRALAHNLLGDYYRAKGDRGEAFWHYLRVDALYDQDAEEHAKALYWLTTLFDKVKNDPLRAQDCAERLRDSRLLGTRYRALADKK